MKKLLLIMCLYSGSLMAQNAPKQDTTKCPCIADNFGNKATIHRDGNKFYVMLISPKGKIKKQYITRELAESRGAK